MLADQATILADLPLHVTVLAKERDVIFHVREAPASAALVLAEYKQRNEDKLCQEGAPAKQRQAGVNLHLFALAYSYE